MVSSQRSNAFRTALGGQKPVFFFGAGISAALGSPDWYRLAELLSKDLGESLAPRGHVGFEQLCGVFSRFEGAFGRNALTRRLQSELTGSKSYSTLVSSIIPFCDMSVVFTTNYDNTIEDTLQASSIPFCAIRSNALMAYFSRNEVNVIKLHGDFGDPSSMVITEKDFLIYGQTHSTMVKYLSATVATKPVIMIGYGANDLNILQSIADLAFTHGEHARRPVIMTVNWDARSTERAKQRGFHVIPTNGLTTDEIQEDIIGLFKTSVL